MRRRLTRCNLHGLCSRPSVSAEGEDMTYNIKLIAALIAIIACGVSFAEPAQAGTCQPVKAKGVGKNIAQATSYAQDDLKQTAKSLKGRVTQATTNCGPVADGYKCKISAVVCPK
jgi:hypothetical protein